VSKYANGYFQVKNPEKYIGNKTPIYRSGWEFVFMNMCDNNPGVLKWASEVIKVPYRNPLTNRQTVYVPDFFMVYVDKAGKQHAEVIEVKPNKETTLEAAGKSKRSQAAAIVNMAKWEAARAWCKQQGLVFRVVTENDIFHQGR
jgi:TnsA endonuclease N terminal